MTSAPVDAARTLIPAAYELKTPRTDDPPAAFGLAAPADSYVVSAPPKPTSRLGIAAAVLWDLVLYMALLYGIALAPGLLIHGVTAAAHLILGNGR